MRQIFSKDESGLQNDKKVGILVVVIAFFYMLVNLYMFSQQFYFFSLLPLVLILIYYYLTALDKIFYLAVFLTPLSFPLNFESFDSVIIVPVEPMFMGILLLFSFMCLYDRPVPSFVIRHPISIFIIMHIFWMIITTVTSQIPIVSVKYTLMQLWYILPVFFFGQVVMDTKQKIYNFFILIIVAITFTSIYTTIHHFIYGFGRDEGKWVMQPFYNDHTAYGAVLALILPALIGMITRSTMNRFIKSYLIIAFVFVSIGIFLSYSRATWLSIALALVFYIILVFRIRIRYIVLGVMLVLMLIILNWNAIIQRLEQNRQDSSQHFVEHVQSITNIRTDASNLERINRWKSAIRMFQDHPVFGTGSGTYQFLYAPYQKYKEKTIISTNAGDRGNAHSEYLGPLAERGLPGLIFFVAIILAVYVTGIRAYYRVYDKEIKMILAVTLTGLTTYVIHGFMNNFLDTNTASVLFWGYIAIITRITIFSKQLHNIEGMSYQLNQSF